MIKKLFMACIFWLCCSSIVLAEQVGLTWNSNTESDLAGYKLYHGKTSGVYDNHIDVGNETSYTIKNLIEGQKYYFALTAYDTFNNESDYSAEAEYTVPNIPPLPPTGINIVIISATNGSPDSINVYSGTRKVGSIAKESVRLTWVRGREYKIVGLYKDF